jgi:hypothetical protein
MTGFMVRAAMRLKRTPTRPSVLRHDLQESTGRKWNLERNAIRRMHACMHACMAALTINSVTRRCMN